MRTLLGLLLLWAGHGTSTLTAQEQRVIVVVGAAGEEVFGGQFQEWAQLWQSQCGHTSWQLIGTDPLSELSDRDRLKQALVESTADHRELWLVLLGHGTFDGRQAKFNLRGPDLTAEDLREWLDSIAARQIVINCSASSSSFLNLLSRPDRLVVTATKDADQYQFSRFGGYLAEALTDLRYDLDKDGQTSLLEAFCGASRGVAEFYQSEGRLATEQALLDDNGDGRGTPADWYRGVRAQRVPQSGTADGLLANQVFLKRNEAERLLTESQRERRNELERELEKWWSRKSQVSEDQYWLAVEPLLIQIAEIYEAAETGTPSTDVDSGSGSGSDGR